MAIWSILLPFGIFYDFLYIFPRFGMLSQEKSGNPGKCRTDHNFVNFLDVRADFVSLVNNGFLWCGQLYFTAVSTC
jgi:hypothetical protein